MEILPYPSLSGDSHPPPPLYYLGTVLEGGGFPNAQIPSFPTPHPLHTQARGASTHPALNSPGFFAYRPMANLLFPDRRGPVTSLPGLWPVSFRSSVASPRSGLRPPGTQGQGAAQRPICGREEHSTQPGRVLDKHRRLPEGLQASPSCFIMHIQREIAYSRPRRPSPSPQLSASSLPSGTHRGGSGRPRLRRQGAAEQTISQRRRGGTARREGESSAGEEAVLQFGINKA